MKVRELLFSISPAAFFIERSFSTPWRVSFTLGGISLEDIRHLAREIEKARMRASVFPVTNGDRHAEIGRRASHEDRLGAGAAQLCYVACWYEASKHLHVDRAVFRPYDWYSTRRCSLSRRRRRYATTLSCKDFDLFALLDPNDTGHPQHFRAIGGTRSHLPCAPPEG